MLKVVYQYSALLNRLRALKKPWACSCTLSFSLRRRLSLYSLSSLWWRPSSGRACLCL